MNMQQALKVVNSETGELKSEASEDDAEEIVMEMEEVTAGGMGISAF